MSLPIPLLSPLGAGLVWAIVCDLRRRRIPNVLSGAIFVTGLAISGYHGGASAVLSGLAAVGAAAGGALQAVAGRGNRRR